MKHSSGDCRSHAPEPGVPERHDPLEATWEAGEVVPGSPIPRRHELLPPVLRTSLQTLQVLRTLSLGPDASEMRFRTSFLAGQGLTYLYVVGHLLAYSRCLINVHQCLDSRSSGHLGISLIEGFPLKRIPGPGSRQEEGGGKEGNLAPSTLPTAPGRSRLAGPAGMRRGHCGQTPCVNG